jgi:hypothetical protein
MQTISISWDVLLRFTSLLVSGKIFCRYHHYKTCKTRSYVVEPTSSWLNRFQAGHIGDLRMELLKFNCKLEPANAHQVRDRSRRREEANNVESQRKRTMSNLKSGSHIVADLEIFLCESIHAITDQHFKLCVLRRGPARPDPDHPLAARASLPLNLKPPTASSV